jgi:(p)ppGpp synthase/HD superfamily hydrolase
MDSIMQKSWSQDQFIRAYTFAANAHEGLLLPGSSLPYLVHISLVCMEIMALQSVEPLDNPDLALQCAALHDVVEDTSVTLEKILEDFGQQVADGVSALTKNKDHPNPMADSLRRIRKQPVEIAAVKLADRITNLQAPPFFWAKAKIKEYCQESIEIADSLNNFSPFLSDHLQKKIDIYQLNYCK